MKYILDTCESLTGWSAETGTPGITLTTWKEFGASFRSSQIKIVPTAVGDVVKKVFDTAIDVSAFDVISILLVADTNETVVLGPDHRMRVKFYDSDDNSEVFYLPTGKYFGPRTFVTSLNNIKKIEFIFDKIVSIMVAEVLSYKDTMPYDVYTAIAELIEHAIESVPRFQVGTVTCSKGDSSITIPKLKYVDKHTVLRIGNELHQVMSGVANNVVTFGTYADGKNMKADYVNEPVYIEILPQITPVEYDAFIPSISINDGIGPEIAEDYEPYSVTTDSWKEDDTLRVYDYGTVWKYTIIVEASSKINGDLNEYLLLILKKAFNKKTLIWINGRVHDLVCTGVESVEYGDATEILSKLRVECIIECAEEIWQTERQPMNLNPTKTVEVIVP